MPLALTLLLLLGWFVLPFPWFWTAAVTVIVLLPLMAAAGWQLINKPEDVTLTSHFIEVGVSIRDFLIRFIFRNKLFKEGPDSACRFIEKYILVFRKLWFFLSLFLT